MLVFLLLFCPGADSKDDHKTRQEYNPSSGDNPQLIERTGLEDDSGLKLKPFWGNIPGLNDNGLMVMCHFAVASSP